MEEHESQEANPKDLARSPWYGRRGSSEEGGASCHACCLPTRSCPTSFLTPQRQLFHAMAIDALTHC